MDDNGLMAGWSDFWAELTGAFTVLRTGLFALLFQPWGLIQLAVLLALLVLAHLAARWAEPALEAWVRDLDTTRQRLRVLAILLRRLRLLFFVLGAWLAFGLMRTLTLPERAYLLGVAAAIATVWLALSLIGRLVKNRLLARTLTATAVVLATVQILGLMPAITAVLDAAALSAGDFRLSLLTIIRTALVLGLLLTAASFLSGFTERRVDALADISPSMRVLTGKVVRIGLFTLAVIVGLQSVGLDLTTLTVFSGAVGLGIGFGLQKVVSNLISGVILLLDKSVKPGDVIEVGNGFGWIAKLGARYASVVTRDGREYLIPNEDLITQQVVNWSHSNTRVRLEVPFGVSYEADPQTVRKIAVEAAQNARRVLGVPVPVCHLTGFGESSVDYVLRFWIADPSGGVANVRSDVLIALWYGLKDADIAIPFPHRDLAIKEPVTVRFEQAADIAQARPAPRRARPRRRDDPAPSDD